MKKIFPFILLIYANILFAQFPCSSGISFNGADDSISPDDTDAINLRNVTDRTIEFWFKTADISTKQVLYKEGGGSHAILFFLEGDRIYLGAYRLSANLTADRRFFRSGNGDIEVDKWYHLALTLAGGNTLKWFLNGVEQDSQTATQVNSHTGDIVLGKSETNLKYPSTANGVWGSSSIVGSTAETSNVALTGNDSNPYDYKGNISLFRIWNVARNESQINTNKSTLITNETDLVAFSDLDRIYYEPDGADEISLTAFVSVTTESTTIPNTTFINEQATSNRTLEFRFKATDLTTRQVLYEEGGNTNAITAFIEDGRFYFGVYRNNTANAADRRYFRSGDGVVEVGVWYHVALTLDNATTLKWFLDGVEQDSQTGMVVDNHNGDINIGKSGGNMRYPSSLVADWDSSLIIAASESYNGAVTSNASAYQYTGDIDLFRIWNIVRTPAEINANKEVFINSGTDLVAYQSGAQINYQPTGGTSPSASEDAEGIGSFTWSGVTDNSWTTNTNWEGDTPPNITRSQKVTITNNGTNPVIAADTNVGFLNISTGVNLIVQSGSTLNVYYDLNNNGTITVENGASLIYHNCNEPIVGTGTFDVIRNTRNYGSGNNNFYSYWSSPVIGATIGTVFPDADEVYEYVASSADADWVKRTFATTMQAGFGYAVQNEAIGGQVRTFGGIINEGSLDVTLYFNINGGEGESGNEWSPGGDNLVGNPYPSAIDWDLVVKDTDNQNIEGTIYLWNQTSAETGDNNVSDYLLYNALGPSMDNTATSKIGTAQSFFVRTSSSLGSGGTTTLKLKATHQVAGDNVTFYKSSKKNEVTDKQKGRSWFRLKKGNLFNSILIGFVKEATEKYDRLYDGPFNINQKELGFYSLVEDTKKTTIQGLPLLTENEKIVSLGFVVDEIREYSINLQQEYIDDSYYIYLEDREANIFVDLNEQSYTFLVHTVGENNSRFRIIYTKEKKETLSVDNPLSNDKNLLVYTNSLKELVVKHLNSEEIEKITLYTILGREVRIFNSNEKKGIADLQTGMYLVKINLKGNKVVSKKIVIGN